MAVELPYQSQIDPKGKPSWTRAPVHPSGPQRSRPGRPRASPPRAQAQRDGPSAPDTHRARGRSGRGGSGGDNGPGGPKYRGQEAGPRGRGGVGPRRAPGAPPSPFRSQGGDCVPGAAWGVDGTKARLSGGFQWGDQGVAVSQSRKVPPRHVGLNRTAQSRARSSWVCRGPSYPTRVNRTPGIDLLLLQKAIQRLLAY